MRTFRCLVMAICLLWATTAFGANPPTIEESSKTAGGFTVTYDAGAVYACLVFENQDVIDRDKDGKIEYWTPRLCGFLDDTRGTFEEEWKFGTRGNTWKVWASIGYPRSGDASKGENPTTTYVDYVQTNVLTVKR